MKIKIDEIECKSCHKEFSHESNGWDFSTEIYESGCDCCSDEAKIVVWVKCSHCNESFDLEIG